MRASRNGRRAVALAAIAWAWAAWALDAPHDASTIQGSQGCDDCHALHTGSGPGITDQPDTFTLCTNCHNALGASFGFGGAWYSSDQATPGAGGRSHHWNTSTTNAAYGATPPTDPELLKRASDGYLQCSVCHNQHASAEPNAPYNRHISVATGVALAQSGGPASGATMRLTVGAGTPAAKGYRIRIGPANNQFQVSHDARNGWGAATWSATPYTIPGSGVPVPLSQAGDDPTLSVAFTPVPSAAGGYWDFYVSYPFLRMSMAEGALCINCHAARNQTYADVETSATYGWGTNKPFSHPVGQGLNANGRSYDLATPLEVNGAAQGGTPTTSYLRLSPTGKVTCVTCHAAHNADSNSQTVDAR